MPNYGHTAICPFYMGEKPKTISCEDAFRRFKDEKRRYVCTKGHSIGGTDWRQKYAVCDEWESET